MIFYSNIVVYGYFGFYYIEILDGFKMDVFIFSIGMVYDGIEIEDLEF